MKVQGENSGRRAIRLVKHAKMEVNGKKKLDQRKKEQQKQLRIIGNFAGVPQALQDVLKETGQKEPQDKEQRRNDILPEHHKMQKRSQKLQSL